MRLALVQALGVPFPGTSVDPKEMICSNWLDTDKLLVQVFDRQLHTSSHQFASHGDTRAQEEF
jgi:hypothetical protein